MSGSPVRRLRRVAVVIGAGLLATASVVVGVGAYRARAKGPVALGVRRVAVRRADLWPTLTAGGLVETSRRTIIQCDLQNLAYSNEGRSISAGVPTILELIPEGTVAQRGDVLCRIDSSGYEELVRQQEIKLQQSRNDFEKAGLDVRTAEMALTEFRDGTLPQQLEAMDSQVVLVESDLQRQSDRIKWAEKMVRNGYFSAGQLAAERDRYVKSEVSRKNLIGQRSYLRDYSAPLAIQRLEVAVNAAKSLLTYQELRLRRMTQRMDLFRKQVSLCTIRAPHDGLVVYANHPGRPPEVEVGRQVHQNKKLFYLPDLSRMEIQAVLNESVVDRVAANMKARVRIEGLHDSTIEGHVASVSALPIVHNMWGGQSDVKDYMGVIRLHSTPSGLRPGMTAEVAITTGHVEDVLAIPPQAVLVEGDRDFCYVEGRDGLERREVTLGQATRSLVEVKSGLEEGEQVIVEPSRLEEQDVQLASARKVADDTDTPEAPATH